METKWYCTIDDLDVVYTTEEIRALLEDGSMDGSIVVRKVQEQVGPVNSFPEFREPTNQRQSAPPKVPADHEKSVGPTFGTKMLAAVSVASDVHEHVTNLLRALAIWVYRLDVQWQMTLNMKELKNVLVEHRLGDQDLYKRLRELEDFKRLIVSDGRLSQSLSDEEKRIRSALADAYLAKEHGPQLIPEARAVLQNREQIASYDEDLQRLRNKILPDRADDRNKLLIGYAFAAMCLLLIRAAWRSFA